jgi:hypothetical protein
MWTHGHGVRIENPDQLASEWRAGFYVRLVGRPGARIWVHYSIPTPVLVGRDRIKVDSIMVRFRSVQRDDAWITAVHIYDGENRIAAHDHLNHRSETWVWPRFPVPGHPEVRWGVGVSIQLTFSNVHHLREGVAATLRQETQITGGIRIPPGIQLGGLGGSSPAAGATSPPAAPQIRQAIEISAVGCDFRL